jgi:hypothetical protein
MNDDHAITASGFDPKDVDEFPCFPEEAALRISYLIDTGWGRDEMLDHLTEAGFGEDEARSMIEHGWQTA